MCTHLHTFAYFFLQNQSCNLWLTMISSGNLFALLFSEENAALLKGLSLSDVIRCKMRRRRWVLNVEESRFGALERNHPVRSPGTRSVCRNAVSRTERTDSTGGVLQKKSFSYDITRLWAGLNLH